MLIEIAFTLLILCCLTLFCNYRVLCNAKELQSLEETVAEQQKTDGLYLSGLHHQIHPYKCELFKTRKAEILALGSSRVMQLRESHFTKSFTNGGLLLSTLEDWEDAKELIEEQKPSHIILGIDWWWFNPVYQYGLRRKGINPTKFTPSYLLRPVKGLLKGKISISDYLKLLFNQHGSSHIGINAMVRGDGFAADGSQYRNSLLFTDEADRYFADRHFQQTQKEIDGGKSYVNRFASFEIIDKKRWELFKNIVTHFNQQNIDCFYFLAPTPPAILDKMKEAGKYPALISLQKQLQEFSQTEGLHYLDMLDPRDYGSSDCEMLDGLHAGEVTYIRILQAANLPYTDPSYLDIAIKGFSGCAGAYKSELGPERDFLGLGCKKAKDSA